MGDAPYLVVPRQGTGPGVLVLHSWWGLNAFFRGFCDRLGREGFVVVAPDLYGGKVAATIAEAKKLRAETTASRREPAYKVLIRMINLLSGHEAVSRPGIGLIGFSMGGHWAFWLAQRPELPIEATVTFYAARNGAFSQTRSTFLAHFAETDEWVSAAGIRKLKKSLEAAGKSPRFYTYPGTGHWFFEQDRSREFNPEAAALAWPRTLEFLKEELGLTGGARRGRC